MGNWHNLEKNSLLQKRYFSHTIRTLVSIIDHKDIFTRGHSEKVMKYCAKVAKILDIEKDETTKIKIAALLHDIGKFRVDGSILYKPGKLNEVEWREIKKHPLIGAKVLEAAGLLKEIVTIVKHHHARFAGGGYPNSTIRNKDIPLGSRIILVADAFDAMTSQRPYRRDPMNKKEALKELKRCAGSQFDPQVVTAFTNSIS